MVAPLVRSCSVIRAPSTSVPLRLALSTMCQRPFASYMAACSLDTDACSTATSTRGSRPMRLPSEIACATPHASISEARGLGTREKICSLVMPGDAIATPCEVHSTPIERGDEQSRQLTMHIDDHLFR